MLWRIAKWTLGGLFVLIVLLLLLLIFAPLNAAKDYALENVDPLNKLNVSIGNIDFCLLSGIEIRDVVVGPPAGYKKNVASIDLIRVDYDVWPLLSGEFIINEILIERPHANLETIDGKTNIDALLALLPQGTEEEKQPEPPQTSEDTQGEPSDFMVHLNRFEVRHVSAWVNDGQRVVDFSHLGVLVSGYFSEPDSHFDVRVRIEPDQKDGASLLVTQQEPVRLDTDVALLMDLNVALDNVQAPIADLTLALSLATKKLSTDWALDPIDLKVNVAAMADMPTDLAKLNALKIAFNGKDILDMHATLEGLIEQRRIDLLLARLNLPLDAFAPYAKAFEPGVDFGGRVAIDDLALKGDIQKLLKSGLPEMNGKVLIEDVWAAYEPQDTQVSDIDLDLELSTHPAPSEAQPNALFAKGRLSIGTLKAKQAGLSRLALDIEAGADGLQLADAKTALALAIGKISYSDPALGTLALSLKLDMNARANLPQGRFMLDALNINVSDTIRLGSRADASVDLSTTNVDAYTISATIKPIPLARLMTLVPAKLRAKLPRMDLDGTLGLSIDSKGAVPAGVTDPMALPVSFSTRIDFGNIDLDYPEQHLQLEDFSGHILVKGTPKAIRIDSPLAIARIVKADQQLSLNDIRLPLKIETKPAKGATLSLNVRVVSATSGLQAATVHGVALDLDTDVSGNLLLQRPRELKGRLRFSLDDALYAKATTARVEQPEITLDFNYSQNKKTGRLDLNVGIAKLELPNERVIVNDFSYAAQAEVEGVDMPILPHPDQHAELAKIGMQMKIAGIELPRIFGQPLENTTFNLKAAMHDMKDADLESLRFSMPSLGALVTMEGKLWGALDRSYRPPNFKDKWPEFDVEIFAGLDLEDEKELIEGIVAEGKVGLSTRARSLPGNRAKVVGRIVGENFGFTQTVRSEKTLEDGSTETSETRISLVDFDADAPMVQHIDLETLQPIQSEANIFDASSRNVLYDVMRQYSSQQANFHIDDIDISMRKGETERRIKVDEISLDMMYQDGVFAIDRMYVDLLGGGITGALQAQLVALPPAPMDVRVHFENQIAGVNLAYLTQSLEKKVSSDTEISSLINLDFGLSERFMEGEVKITRLSLAQLDELLQFLDPKGKDPNVQRNREMINSWYVDMIDPKVELVSIEIDYSNINLDIYMDAWFFVGDILQATLNNSKIRRLDLVPILNAHLPPVDGADSKAEGSAGGAGSATGLNR